VAGFELAVEDSDLAIEVADTIGTLFGLRGSDLLDGRRDVSPAARS
jgi:hypothetical protein